MEQTPEVRLAHRSLHALVPSLQRLALIAVRRRDATVADPLQPALALGAPG